MSKKESAGEQPKVEVKAAEVKEKPNTIVAEVAPKKSIDVPPVPDVLPTKKPAGPKRRVRAPQAGAEAPMQPTATAVRLDVFCKLTGFKFDKLAGFRYAAKKQRLGPMTIPQWWSALAEFNKRPIR